MIPAKTTDTLINPAETTMVHSPRPVHDTFAEREIVTRSVSEGLRFAALADVSGSCHFWPGMSLLARYGIVCDDDDVVQGNNTDFIL